MSYIISFVIYLCLRSIITVFFSLDIEDVALLKNYRILGMNLDLCHITYTYIKL